MHGLTKRHVSSPSFSFGPSPCLLAPRLLQLLRPLLTSRSGSPRRPFRHKARSPQVRTRSFPAQPPHLRRLTLGHKSFAVDSLLALVGNASYPVLVHRLTVSLRASSPRSVALTQLRFTCLAVASSAGDLHPEDRAHAGRTVPRPTRRKRRIGLLLYLRKTGPPAPALHYHRSPRRMRRWWLDEDGGYLADGSKGGVLCAACGV